MKRMLMLIAVVAVMAGCAGIIPAIPNAPEQVKDVIQNFKPMEPVCIYSYEGKVVITWIITDPKSGAPLLSGKITMTLDEWKALMGKSSSEIWAYLYKKATECVALGQVPAAGGTEKCQK